VGFVEAKSSGSKVMLYTVAIAARDKCRYEMLRPGDDMVLCDDCGRTRNVRIMYNRCYMALVII